MNRRKAIVAISAGGASASAFTPSTEADPEDARPVDVSLIQLIAAPATFDGKAIRVWGFVRIEHEATAVYLHRDDWEHSLTKNGLWLATNDAAPEGTKEAEVNNRYALIEGRFNANMKGHMGLWSGSIERITRMEAWEIRKGQK